MLYTVVAFPVATRFDTDSTWRRERGKLFSLLFFDRRHETYSSGSFLCSGSRAWAGLTHQQIVKAVSSELQLDTPEGVPPVIKTLLEASLSKKPEDRYIVGVMCL